MPTAAWNTRWAKGLRRFKRGEQEGHYGDHWGDPTLTGLRYRWHRLRNGRTQPGDLGKVVKRHLRPYVTPDSVVMEIGPGGGRFTQFLVGAREVVLVDLNKQFFRYLRKRFRKHRRKLTFYKPFLQEAEEWNGFSDMNAPRMEALLAGRGFEVVEHDRALLDHSNVVVIRKPAA